MKKNLHFASARQNEFHKEIKSVADRKPTWEVWADWIEMVALLFSVASEFRPKVREERAKRYLDIAKKYSQDELNAFDRMLDILVDALEDQPEQDFLGEMYQALNLNDHWKGQFFTPYDVAVLMAKITMSDVKEQTKDRDWAEVSILDPCSGAAVLLVAARNHFARIGMGYDKVLFVGEDIDKIAGLMGYIQMSLLGCAGYIAIGDSLAHPIVWHNGSKLLPKDDPAYELWFMPILRTPVWEYRRAKALLGLETNYKDDKEI